MVTGASSPEQAVVILELHYHHSAVTAERPDSPCVVHAIGMANNFIQGIPQDVSKPYFADRTISTWQDVLQLGRIRELQDELALEATGCFSDATL